MHLELTSEEARELKQALESDLTKTFDEIAHADNREFRAELKARADRLQEIERKLAPLITGLESEAYA